LLFSGSLVLSKDRAFSAITSVRIWWQGAASKNSRADVPVQAYGTLRDFVSGFENLAEPAGHGDEADQFSVHLNCCKSEITREKGSCGPISTKHFVRRLLKQRKVDSGTH
jgi:hypothetical protein